MSSDDESDEQEKDDEESYEEDEREPDDNENEEEMNDEGNESGSDNSTPTPHVRGGRKKIEMGGGKRKGTENVSKGPTKKPRTKK